MKADWQDILLEEPFRIFFPLGVLGGLVGVFPACEVAMLHLTFVGGFGLITLMIASRVVVAHCNFEDLWGRNAWSLAVPGSLLVLSAVARLGADLLPAVYLTPSASHLPSKSSIPPSGGEK